MFSKAMYNVKIHYLFMAKAIGAKHASVVLKVSVSWSVHHKGFHYILFSCLSIQVHLCSDLLEINCYEAEGTVYK